MTEEETYDINNDNRYPRLPAVGQKNSLGGERRSRLAKSVSERRDSVLVNLVIAILTIESCADKHFVKIRLEYVFTSNLYFIKFDKF